METFLELMETLNAENATVERLFGDAGRSVRRRNADSEYMRSLTEAATLYADVCRGRRPLRLLMEAMTTSDFPLLFGDVLDRAMLARYQAWPSTWQAVARRSTVRDFRTVNRFTADGGDAVLENVPEATPYPADRLYENRYQLSVKKYGRRIPFTWEMAINEDLDFLQNLPGSLALAARRSEDRFVSDIYVGPNGPDASLYTVGNGNIVTGNPALSITGLQTAFTAISGRTDPNTGEPIFIDMVTLVVPPALEVVANNLMNATVVRNTATFGGATGVELETVNWLSRRMRVVVNPYIPVIASTANGNTTWFLFANPDNNRPAIDFALLRGHETPEIFRKTGNQERVGGGSDPMDGDFEHDQIEYKVRHVFGGAVIDPRMTVASNGSGA